MKKVVLALFLMVMSINMIASHIVGGNLEIKKISETATDGRFDVRIVGYRDCSGINFNPDQIDVFDAITGARVLSEYNLQQISVTPMVQATNCSQCIEKWVYKAEITLPNNPNGYTIVFDECCRNGITTNLQSPSSTDYTFYAKIADPDLIPLNNISPSFSSYPSNGYFCIGQTSDIDLNVDFSTQNQEGDSLVFSLTNPLSSYTAGNFYQQQYANWISGFNSTTPLGPGSVTSINQAGVLSGNSNSLGVFAFAILIEEYHNGVKIGEYTRELEYNVCSCSNSCNIQASFFDSIVNNQGTIDFYNTSTGVNSNEQYWWNFGDGSSSGLETPSHTYTTSGVYNVCLIVSEGNCSDTICENVTVSVQDPCVNFSAGYNYSEQGSSYSFILNDSSNVCNVSWDFGDGTRGQGDYTNHVYQQSGIYTVCAITYSCNQQCVDTVCQNITVNVQDPCANFDGTFQAYESPFFLEYDFMLNDSSNICNVSWDFGDGTIGQGDYTNHIYQQSGIYNVCATVISCNQQCIDTVCQTIFVDDSTTNGCNLTANFSSSVFGDTVYLTSTTTGIGTNPSYQWNVSGGTYVNSDIYGNAWFFAPNGGDYQICLTVDNQGSANQCVDDYCDSISVVVQDPCAGFNAGFQVNESFFGSGYSFVLNDSSNVCNVSWDFGDGTVGQGDYTNHVYQQNGAYTVCAITYSCNQQCIDTACQTIFVNDSTNTGCNLTANFSSYISGDTVYLTSTTTGIGTNPSYQWNVSGGTYVNSDINGNAWFIAPNGGDYQVCLTVDNQGSANQCIDDYCDSISVDVQDPCVDFSAEFQVNESFFGSGYSFVLNDSSNVCNVSWDFGDGTVGQGDYTNHVYQQNGAYTVCAIAYSCNQQCIDTVCQTIFVNDSTNTGCNLTANFSSYISGDTVYLTSTTTGIGTNPSYQWNASGGTYVNSDINGNAWFIAPNGGDYQVCLTVDNQGSANQCIDDYCDSISVDVQDPCVDFSAEFQVNESFFGAGYSFVLNDSSNVCNVSWDFGDGIVGQGDYTNHVYQQNGAYTVCAIAYSCNQQCIDTVCQTIFVNDSTNSGCNLTANFSSYISGDTVYLTSTTTGIGTNPSYQWNVSGGTYVNSDINGNAWFIASNGGNYQICLTVDNQGSANQCIDDYCDSISVDVQDPCADFSAGYNYYNQGAFYTFSLNDSSDVCSVYWDFGDGTVGQGDYTSHTYQQNGIYTVCAIVYSCNQQCIDTVCQSIFVSGGTGGCNLTANYTTTISGDTVYLTSTTTGVGYNPSYQWNVSGGVYVNSDINGNAWFIAPNGGSYHVCLTVDNQGSANQCIDDYCDTVVVSINPCDFNASFVKQDGQSGTSFTTPSVANANYFWNFGDGTTSNLQNPIHQYSSSATYNVCLYVTVTNGNDCAPLCIKHVCEDVAVNCNVPCNLQASFNTELHGDTLVLINTSVTSDSISYLNWEVYGNSTHAVYGQSDDTGYSYIDTAEQFVIVCLTIETGNQTCISQLCDTVLITDLMSGIGESDLVFSTMIYPNPAQNLIEVQLNGNNNEETSLEIMDYQGKVIIVDELKRNSKKQINISSLAKGSYFLRVINSKSGNVIDTKQFIKS